jgi:trehalose 6-phosphate phosphatase
MVNQVEEIAKELFLTDRLWLFLDYDGTLADFAPSPDHVIPDEGLSRLLEDLAKESWIRPAVISGRRLSHVVRLLPNSNFILAGTYGLEVRTISGEIIQLVDFEELRPTLDSLKPELEKFTSSHRGFYLEDKGWALAIHGRFARDEVAENVLGKAHQYLLTNVSSDKWRILGGEKFLEICPTQANKGLTVTRLLDTFPWPGSLPVYIGDDDKDEEAFDVIKSRGGIAILVATQFKPSRADFRLFTPADVRALLKTLLEHTGKEGSND